MKRIEILSNVPDFFKDSWFESLIEKTYTPTGKQHDSGNFGAQKKTLPGNGKQVWLLVKPIILAIGSAGI